MHAERHGPHQRARTSQENAHRARKEIEREGLTCRTRTKLPYLARRPEHAVRKLKGPHETHTEQKATRQGRRVYRRWAGPRCWAGLCRRPYCRGGLCMCVVPNGNSGSGYLSKIVYGNIRTQAHPGQCQTGGIGGLAARLGLCGVPFTGVTTNS